MIDDGWLMIEPEHGEDLVSRKDAKIAGKEGRMT